MLNIVQMISDITDEVNNFKKDNLDNLKKTYDEKMGKVEDVKKQIDELPESCAGKSQTYKDKKKKQLEDKLKRLTKSVEEWYDSQKKSIIGQTESMLDSSKEAAQKAVDEEKNKEKEAKELSEKMSQS